MSEHWWHHSSFGQDGRAVEIFKDLQNKKWLTYDCPKYMKQRQWERNDASAMRWSTLINIIFVWNPQSCFIKSTASKGSRCAQMLTAEIQIH